MPMGKVLPLLRKLPSELRKRWRDVCLLVAIGVMAYLIGQSINEGHKRQQELDSIRKPVCSIMDAALSRPPMTPQQAEARKIYLAYLGIGTPDEPGLRCPRLPGA